MIAQIQKGIAHGTVRIPASKSIAHRLLICAALADGKALLSPLDSNRDVSATLGGLSALGAGIHLQGQTAEITGISKAVTAARLDCGESGSTLRFLLPVSLQFGGDFTFTGAERLFERPLSVYREICRNQGISFREAPDHLSVSGQLRPGEFAFPGDISSQFLTGLFFALPFLKGDSSLTLTTPLQSQSYVQLTLEALKRFGVSVTVLDSRHYRIRGNQRAVSPKALSIPGDQSSAAFFAALNTLGGRVALTGLSDRDAQGDRVYAEQFPLLCRGCPTLDLSDCPDLAPILMALGALHHGVHLTKTSRLRLKESDRGQVMAEELRKFGVAVTVRQDEIFVSGGVHCPTEALCSHNDHRIAMSLAVVCTVTGGTILGAECVAKSLPSFWENLSALSIPVRLLQEEEIS